MICLSVAAAAIIFLVVYVYVLDGPRVGREEKHQAKKEAAEGQSKKLTLKSKAPKKPCSTISGSVSKATSSNVPASGVASKQGSKSTL